MALRFKNPSRVGNQLRAARQAAGYSLSQLSVDTGVHHSQISRIERGLAVTLSENVQKICKKLRVDLSPRTQPAALAARIAKLEAVVPESTDAIDALLTTLEGMAQLPGATVREKLGR